MTAESPGAIRAREVGFQYAGDPRPALSDVTFELEPGRFLLVLGPSGSGKSTLALALAGLIPGDYRGRWAGRLEVAGLDTRAAARAEIASRVAVVFQDPASQIVMERVEDDVAFGLENRGWPRERMLARVPAALGRVGLNGFERRRTSRLSGGQQQRVALAGVLAPSPGILVLDEPTSNLDPEAADGFVRELARVRGERSATVVLVEHRVDLVWDLADRVLALDRSGRPIAFGDPDGVVRKHGRRLVDEGVWLPEAYEREGVDSTRARPTRPDPSAATLVEARGLGFAYERGRPVVRDVDLTIAEGERVALVGRNGSGKSTLARLLVGLLRPQAGTVDLGAARPHGLPAHQLARRAGYVFQDPEQQFLTDRVEDEVMLGLDDRERAGAGDVLDALGLPLGAFADRSPYRLSGGEKRRLSVACSLVRDPSLLVLDEPTFGQDRLAHEALLDILAVRVRGGTAVLAATHDTRFVRDFAARTVSLADGRIASDGTTDASVPGAAIAS